VKLPESGACQIIFRNMYFGVMMLLRLLLAVGNVMARYARVYLKHSLSKKL
jgi:hypothetical protein